MNDTTSMPLIFVGTYTEKESHVEGKADGIYIYALDTATGRLHHVNTTRGIKNPSYVAIHPGKQYVYAVSETTGNGTGLVYAYRFDSNSRQLTQINAVASEGTSPCYVSVHPSGKFVLVANYGNGTVALLGIREDGGLEAASCVQHKGKGPTDRQEAPHAHMVIPGEQNGAGYVYAVDLGIDQVKQYTLDEQTRSLKDTREGARLAPGSGPRHLAFHPIRNWAYVINELEGSVVAFRVGQDGRLEQFQTISALSATPEGADAGAADIHVTPSGKYLYTSNRGIYNNIAMFAIDQDSGALSSIGFQSCKGKVPRDFTIDPSGTFLLVANQDTDQVVTFRIDHATGKLVDTGIATDIPTPVCLQFRG